MKKIILVVIGSLFCFYSLCFYLVGCKTDGTNYDKCLESVKKTFPNSKVYNSINVSKYRFIVIDTSNNVFEVETMNTSDANVTSINIERLQ